MCIAEAVVALLAYHEIKQLKVYQVVQKAGVSRMTFYKYYSSPQAALEDYLQIIISKFITESNSEINGNAFSYEHILFALNFFDRYRDFFIIMKTKGLYAVLMDSVNSFLTDRIGPMDGLSLYRQYSYAGSLLNCFLMWELGGKKEKAEDIAKEIHALFRPAAVPSVTEPQA